MEADPKENATGSGTSVVRQIFHALLLYFANTYDIVFGLDTGPPLHDPVAVAVLLSNLNPAIDSDERCYPLVRFSDKDGERFVVNVVTDGQHGTDPILVGQLGRTIAKSIEGGKRAGGITIPRGIDVKAFWDTIMDCLRRADLCNVARSEREGTQAESPAGT